MRAVHAGDGYRYLLNSVASNDDPTQPKMHLHEYYEAKGTPPGRWFGRGFAGLGQTTAWQGNVVEEDQMAALYGAGLHPDAEAKIHDGATIKDVQLGRSYPNYSKGVPVLDAVKTVERNFRESEGRLPNDEERNDMALEVARPFYEAQAGVAESSGREVLAWLNAEKNKVQQAVAGMDLTFSPAKSVSVLWALGDDETREKIQEIHQRSVQDSLELIENEMLFTRTGARGERQIKARGMLAATFVHYDTRQGDPDLHTHCLLSNKVQAHPDAGLDEADAAKWRALDTRFLFKNSAKIGQRYQRMMTQRLSEEMGLSFRARVGHDGKEPVWEIDGIDDAVLDEFSGRRTNARPVYEQYAAEYAAKHGHAPSDRVRYQLWQQAILDTRDAKKPAQSLADHRTEWTQRVHPDAIAGVRTVAVDDRPIMAAFGTQERIDAIETLAAQAVEDTRSRRAYFAPRHLDTSISMRLNQWRFASEAEEKEVRQAAYSYAMHTMIIASTDTPTDVLPDALMGTNGHVIDRDSESIRLIAKDTLDEENIVLDALNEPCGYLAPRAEVDAALATHEDVKGFALNTAQEALVRHFTESGTTIATGVGPAGTGKTASMAVVADIWKARGHNVLALAPSAQAAHNLGADINTEGRTLASLTYTWRENKTLDNLPVTITPGDMLIVDEAGMATTADIASIVEIAHASGAVVRFVGDPHQLDAVETGGLFRTMVKRDEAVELDQVMRVGGDTTQAAAGLAIRHGDVTGLDVYASRGWLHGGIRADMLTQAVTDHLADEAQGLSGLLIASRRDDVNTANQLIQDARMDAGLIEREGPSVTLGTGQSAYVGDTILTRKNTYIESAHQKVLNGQLFHVDAVHPDGSLAVTSRERGTTLILPADYVRNSVQLGYSATVHRAQGATVDVARAVVGVETDRRGLYVALTRGKKQNHAYVAEDSPLDLGAEDAHWHMSGENTAPNYRDILESIVTRDSGQRSATDMLAEQHRAADSPQRKKELYGTAVDMLTTQWRRDVVEPHIRRVLDQQPIDFLERIDEDQAVERISTTAVALARHGIDYRELMDAATTSLGGSEDIGAVIAHRLREYLPDKSPDLPALPPVHAGTDAQLHDWATLTRYEIAPERNLRSLETPLPTSGEIIGQDFSNMDLRSIELNRVKFVDCNFTGAALDHSELHRVTFRNCDFTGATLTGLRTGEGDGPFQMSQFTRCDLTGADFAGAQLDRIHMVLSTLDDVDFTQARLGTATINQTSMRGTIFDATVFSPQLSLSDNSFDENTPAELVDMQTANQLNTQEMLSNTDDEDGRTVRHDAAHDYLARGQDNAPEL